MKPMKLKDQRRLREGEERGREGEGESDRRKRGRKNEIISEKDREERKRNLSSRRKFLSRERERRAVVEES